MMSDLPCILLVEDDDAGRMMLAEVLKLSGYEIQEAASYRQALRCADREPAAIAVIDLRLPDGDGLKLMHRLRQKHPDMIMVICTGHATLQTAVDALNEGAYAYLLKPYDPQAMLATIRQAAEKWRLEGENRELLRQTRIEADRVLALLQASEEINAFALDTRDLGRRIVQTAVRIMAAHAGFVGLLEDETIRVTEWWNAEEWIPVDWSLKEGEGAPGHVWKTRKTYRTDNVADDRRLLPAIAKSLRRQTMICCPILTRYGEFLGVLDLSDKNGGEPFGDVDALFLEGLCRHVAVALENGRLYEDQRRTEMQRKQFYRDVVSAATHNKLILCERWEMEPPSIEPVLRMRVSEARDISNVRYSLARIVGSTEYLNEERMDSLQLCVGEAATNALKHAGGGEVAAWTDEEGLIIRIEDQGPGIDATTLPKATLLPGYSTKASLGMGLTIILEFMDVVRLNTDSSGTRLDMRLSWLPHIRDPLEAFELIPEL